MTEQTETTTFAEQKIVTNQWYNKRNQMKGGKANGKEENLRFNLFY